MSWNYALVNSQVGLQFVGTHPRAKDWFPSLVANLVKHGIGTMKLQLETALQHRVVYPAVMPGDVIDANHTIFVPRSLVFRLSKWCDHEGGGEADARKFVRKLFRHSNEEDTVPRRFLNQENHAKPSRAVVLADFEAWADRVIIAWGGTPNKPPEIGTALGNW
jgi:hypothetical protein